VPYFVYILYSQKTSKYYIGSTSNIEDRLKHHNGGHTPSTKSGTPWEIVKVIEGPDRSRALKLELKIKKRGAKRFLEDINHLYL
jgi:putative endonuclease